MADAELTKYRMKRRQMATNAPDHPWASTREVRHLPAGKHIQSRLVTDYGMNFTR
jgi:hypothetical protein